MKIAMAKNISQSQGFTLIELVVVIILSILSILAILAVLALVATRGD